MPDLYKNPWLGINPGLLRHRVEIQEAVEVNDTFGQPIPAWEELYQNVKSSVTQLRGDELYQARQIHAEVTHEVIARYRAGVIPKHRILWGEKVLDILWVDNLEGRNLILTILAKERL